MAEFEDFEFDFSTTDRPASQSTAGSSRRLKATPSAKKIIASSASMVLTPRKSTMVRVPAPPNTAPARRPVSVAKSDIVVSPAVQTLRRLSSTAHLAGSPKTARQLFADLLEEKERRQADARRAEQARLLQAEDLRREQEIAAREAEREARQRRAAEIKAKATWLDDDDDMEDESEPLLARLRQPVKAAPPRPAPPTVRSSATRDEEPRTASLLLSPARREPGLHDKGWKRLNAVIDREEQLLGPRTKKARQAQSALDNPYPTPESESGLSRAPSEEEDEAAAVDDKTAAATAARFGMDPSVLDNLDGRQRIDIFWDQHDPASAAEKPLGDLMPLPELEQPCRKLASLLPTVREPVLSLHDHQTLSLLLSSGVLRSELRSPVSAAWLFYKLLSAALGATDIVKTQVAMESLHFLLEDSDVDIWRNQFPLVHRVCHLVLSGLGARGDVWSAVKDATPAGGLKLDRSSACYLLCAIVTTCFR